MDYNDKSTIFIDMTGLEPRAMSASIAAATQAAQPGQVIILRSKNQKDQLDGPVHGYKDKTQAPFLTGHYKDGKKDGLWVETLDNQIVKTIYSSDAIHIKKTYTALYDAKNNFQALNVYQHPKEPEASGVLLKGESKELTRIVQKIESWDNIKAALFLDHRTIDTRHAAQTKKAIGIASKIFDWTI